MAVHIRPKIFIVVLFKKKRTHPLAATPFPQNLTTHTYASLMIPP